MRRLSLFFFSILVLIASANAQSLAYEGFVFNGKNFIFDQNSFSVIIGNSGNTLVLRSDGFSTSLSLGECFSKEYRKYCYN